MKRYDYLMEKRQRKINQGKHLSEEEDDELRTLRPNVFTPIMMMFELLHDTVKTNQEYRQKSSKQRKINQTGGATPPGSESPTPPTSPSKKDVLSAAAESAATAAAAAVILQNNKPNNASTPTSTSSPAEGPSAPPLDDNEDKDDNDPAEARRLSELEESLLPLLTKIIVYIEQNKKAEKKKDGEEEEEDEKYPDIGTSAKNSAILVIRRIKKWWNDLIAGGTSDLSSKINLKKAIPQLANNPGDMNKLTAKAEELEKLAEKATDAIHGPLQKIERILSNDVRDIASSSVEGIMNALSLIPGIGTTLQLWRLLQNVIVIMSKSVTTMAGAKEQGVALKTGVQGLKGDFEKMADPNAIANAAAGNAMSQAQGALNAAGGNPMAALSGGNPMAALSGGNPMAALSGGNPMDALKGAGGVGGAMKMIKGGGSKTNHLRSIKKYRREYKQSLREIKKTRKNILRIIKNMV